MIQSMTGYGNSTVNLKNGIIQLELKSLNSKILDLNFQLCPELSSIENELRELLSKILKRGKINLKLNFESSNHFAKSTLNYEIIKSHINDLKKISSLSDSELLKLALKLPKSVSEKKQTVSNQQKKEIFKTVKKAIKELESFRINEGKALKKDIIQNLKKIEKSQLEIKKTSHQRIKKIKQRIKKNLNKLKLENDNERFERELIYYLEKIDINEEIVRLENHTNYFTKTVEVKDITKGKKLSFICQEMGREINTIGSKANFFKIQKKVVEMKNELEKIKEQLLNVL